MNMTLKLQQSVILSSRMLITPLINTYTMTSLIHCYQSENSFQNEWEGIYCYYGVLETKLLKYQNKNLIITIVTGGI